MRSTAVVMALLLAACAPEAYPEGPGDTGRIADGGEEPVDLPMHPPVTAGLENAVPGQAALLACIDAARATQKGSLTRLECVLPEVFCEGPSDVDLTVLRAHPGLRILVLRNLCITDLTGLEALSELRGLDLALNRITEVRAIASATKLTFLNLSYSDLGSAWGFLAPSPFARMSALHTLVLDYANIGDTVAIGEIRSLRRLHLAGNWLPTVRGLRKLEGLETLDISRSIISNLRPLAGLRALSTLDVSENCISDCGGLPGCVEQVGCADSEPEAYGQSLRVSVGEIDSYLPRDMATWTQGQADAAFAFMAAATDLAWDQPISGCNDRANLSSARLADAGYPATAHIASYGHLRALTDDHPLGFAAWDWHFAVVVRVGTELQVLDPAFFDGPASVAAWVARQVNSAGSAIDFDCVAYNQANGSPGNNCAPSDFIGPDGKYRVSAAADVTVTIGSRAFGTGIGQSFTSY